jgi:hypothetical protein
METPIFDYETIERIFNTYKRCAICKVIKVLEQDYNKNNHSDCKLCRKNINKAYYQKKKVDKRTLENPEKNTLEISEKNTLENLEK